MTECPSNPILHEFLKEALADDAFREVAHHVDACPSCQHRLESIGHSDDTHHWRQLRLKVAHDDSTRKPTDEEPTAGSATPERESASPLPAIAEYEVLSLLGRGGMGVVYKARHVRLDRIVAIKTIIAAEHAGPDRLERFQIEARSVARLQHPHILQIYEIGEQAGHLFFSMEYVDGGNLAQRLSDRLFDASTAADLIRTLALAIHHAHDKGVIHRDLKPANILLAAAESGTAKSAESVEGPSFVPKIADFGLAKELQTDSGHTQTGMVLGTPSYMSAEQAAGETDAVGPATDIYALGAILYESLTGRPPFKGSSVVETLEMVRNQDPVPPRQLQPRIPRDLETVCLKCLEKQPPRRYASASALAEDLHRFLTRQPILARPVGRIERISKWVRRRPAVAAMLTLSLALLLVLTIGPLVYGVQMGRHNAVLEYLNGQLRTANDNVRASERSAQRARKQAETDRDRALLEAARRDRDRGLALCQSGDVNLGLLYLARALRLAPAGADQFRRGTSLNLAAWERLSYPPEKICDPVPLQEYSVSIHPDGETAAVGGRHGVVLWDIETNLPKVRLLPHEGIVLSSAFSPDGQLLATSDDRGNVHLWHAETGAAQGKPWKTGPSVQVAFNPRGDRLLTYGIGVPIQLWDVKTRKPRGAPLPVIGSAMAAVFDPDGQSLFIASSQGTGVERWDLATRTRIELGFRKLGGVTAMTISPDGGLLVTGDTDGVLQVWDLDKGVSVRGALRHDAAVTTVDISPDGKWLLTGSDDNTARLWDLATGELRGQPLRHQGRVHDAAFTPGGERFLTAGIDLRVWRSPSDTERGGDMVLPVNGHFLDSLAFSPDSRVLLHGGSGRSARLWNVATGGKIQPPLQHAAVVTKVAFSPDGELALTGCQDGTVHRWQVATKTPLEPVLRHAGSINSLAFRPDGIRAVTSSSDRTARIWDVTTGAPIGPPLQHDGAVFSAVFSPDAKTVLTASADRTARLWNAESGKRVATFPHRGLVSRALFTAAGKTVVTVYSNRVQCWDVATGKVIGKPLIHKGVVRAVAATADGGILLTGSMDRTARLWNVATGEVTILTHRAGVKCVALSPDGTIAMTGSEDDTARMWQVADGAPIGPPTRHPRDVGFVGFSPDGRRAVSGSTGVILTPVPRPLEMDDSRIRLRMKARTGLSLADNGDVMVVGFRLLAALRKEFPETRNP